MTDAERLAAAADRLDELADTADLMGDDVNSVDMRDRASRMRRAGMELLDAAADATGDDKPASMIRSASAARAVSP